MSSQQQPVFGALPDPNVYKLVSPTVLVDASGGTVVVNANTKFNSNLPIDRAAAITEIDWIMSYAKSQQVSNAPNESHWQDVGQLTEALARTAPTLTDPVDIDTIYSEADFQTVQSSAASIAAVNKFRDRVYERHVFRHPWLTVAQQWNLVCSSTPGADNTLNGPKLNVTSRIFFQLITLSADLRSYLATRLQISGQA